MVRDRAAVADDIGDDVLAEVVGGMRVGGIAAELLEQKRGVEHVDAHAGERHGRLARHGRRIFRLLDERADVVVVVDMHDAEGGGFAHRDLQASHGHVGVLLDVLHEHGLVVHLVDVIAGQDDDVFRRVALDDVDVLKHGVGRAGVPGAVRHALAGGQDVEALVAFQPEKIPAALQMADQAMRLVLGRDADAPDAGIERVGQREIDDARLASEMDRRLGPPFGQFQQTAALAAGEHIGHRRTGKGRACGQERHDRHLAAAQRHAQFDGRNCSVFHQRTHATRAMPHDEQFAYQFGNRCGRVTLRAGSQGASAGIVTGPSRSPARIRRWRGRRRTTPCARCSVMHIRVQSDDDIHSLSIRRWVAA